MAAEIVSTMSNSDILSHKLVVRYWKPNTDHEPARESAECPIMVLAKSYEFLHALDCCPRGEWDVDSKVEFYMQYHGWYEAKVTKVTRTKKLGVFSKKMSEDKLTGMAFRGPDEGRPGLDRRGGGVHGLRQLQVLVHLRRQRRHLLDRQLCQAGVLVRQRVGLLQPPRGPVLPHVQG